MAKKRVHEIAKERGISSKEVIAILQKAGLDVKAAASSVDEGDIARAFSNGAEAATNGADAPAQADGDGAPQQAQPAPPAGDQPAQPQRPAAPQRPTRPAPPRDGGGGGGGRRRR